MYNNTAITSAVLHQTNCGCFCLLSSSSDAKKFHLIPVLATFATAASGPIVLKQMHELGRPGLVLPNAHQGGSRGHSRCSALTSALDLLLSLPCKKPSFGACELGAEAPTMAVHWCGRPQNLEVLRATISWIVAQLCASQFLNRSHLLTVAPIPHFRPCKARHVTARLMGLLPLQSHFKG